MRKRTLVLVSLLWIASQAAAQDAAAIRGNWLADVDGVRHIYILIVDDRGVTGINCVDCYNPTNLSFVMDGTLDDSGVSFTVYHDSGNGSPTRDRVTGHLVGGELHIERRPEGSAAPGIRMVLHKPAPEPPSQNNTAPPRRPPYVPPGAPEPMTIEKAVGLWFAGTGPGKQYFIIRRVGPELLGLVCGPCDEPVHMAPLDSFVIDGDQLSFHIVHEDVVPGLAQHVPFVNAARATISRNEMHLVVVPSFEDPETFTPIEMTLLGPVTYQKMAN
jgi:hypothetical protein